MQTLQEPIMHRCMPFLHVALTARLSKPWVGVGLPNICKGSLALSKTAAAPWQLRLGFTCAHSHICSFLIRPRTRRRRRRKLP
jgi:hypothetical protein